MRALEALRQYTCENSGSLMGGVAYLINTSASIVIVPRIGTLGSGAGNAVGGVSRLGLLGLAGLAGIGAATGAIALWDELSGTQSVLLESRITPTSNRDWDYLARKLGIDRRTLSDNLHSCKNYAGIRGDANVQVDDETGDIYHRGEYIGNIYDGC